VEERLTGPMLDRTSDRKTLLSEVRILNKASRGLYVV